VLIRQAQITDLDALALLFDAYRQFYGQPSDLAAAHAFLAERFEHQQSIVFLALDDDATALGFTQLYPSFTSIRMKPIFILNDLYVVPQARKSGVGKALLDAAAQYGRHVGGARLRLSTAIDNHTAQALYEANGWVRDEAFHSYDLALD
jgi:GNAT superfamily N-acetyltransferase